MRYHIKVNGNEHIFPEITYIREIYNKGTELLNCFSIENALIVTLKNGRYYIKKLKYHQKIWIKRNEVRFLIEPI